MKRCSDIRECVEYAFYTFNSTGPMPNNIPGKGGRVQ